MKDRFEIRIDLGSVDYDSLQTDEDYREVAWEKMPDALNQIGAVAAKKAWDGISKAIGVRGSSGQRRRYIEESMRKFRQENLDDPEIMDHIIGRLREIKADIDAGEVVD